MIKKLFGKPSTNVEPKPEQPRSKLKKGEYKAFTGEELLSAQHRQQLVTRVKRLLSVDDGVWVRHYLYAIQRFAEYAQECPASELHHHSRPGGLLDHTLEVLASAVQLSLGYMLPPNAEPEDIHKGVDRWRFAIFIAVLAHDLGKVVTDIQFQYRANPNAPYEPWLSWYGPMPAGGIYQFKYNPRLQNSQAGKVLHENAAMSLVPKLLTKNAIKWIFEDQELIGQLFATITSSTLGGDVIAEIIRKSDMSSVSKDRGGDANTATREHTKNTPIEDKLLTCLRELAGSGDLKKNRPGAALWITENETWFVFKSVLETVKNALLAEGHKGIPNNVVRLGEMLREAGYAISNPQGDSPWSASIYDAKYDWTQKLTFLRVSNQYIWPTTQPECFDGTITPVDKKGVPIEEPAAPVAQAKNEQQPLQLVTEESRAGTNPPDEEFKLTPPPPPPEQKSKEAIPTTSVSVQDSPISTPTAHNDDTNKAPHKPNNEAGEGRPEKAPSEDSSGWVKPIDKYTGSAAKEVHLESSRFLKWLLQAVASQKVRVNEPGAPVHVVDSYIALVTPRIFEVFESKTIAASTYKIGGKGVVTSIQREIFAFNIHKLGSTGESIIPLVVQGERGQKKLSAILLDRSAFPSLDNFSANKAISIKE